MYYKYKQGLQIPNILKNIFSLTQTTITWKPLYWKKIFSQTVATPYTVKPV